MVRRAGAWAGPVLVTGLVLFTLRGFVFEAQLTNEHSDLLSFWLPRWSFLGRQVADLSLPAWNPFEMLGYRFAADPQGGWLYAAPMALFSTLSPSVAMRAMLVLHPLLAGLGLYAFLRIERLDRVPATVGTLSIAAMMTTSELVLSMPFAGFLAWTTIVLVGAAGFRRAARPSGRLAWLALAAFAWSQVAGAHLSHGLAMCTLLVAAYLVAHAVIAARTAEGWWPADAGRIVVFVAVLPLASLAILVPRFNLIGESSLREGYAALEDGVEAPSTLGDRAVQVDGVWAGWPLSLSSSPGAYAGAAVLLAVPLALRARRRRALVWGVGITFAIGYVLLLDAVIAGWPGDLITALPFGDTLIHNPGRFRYLAVLAAPILGAAGIQGLRDDPLPARRLAPWVAGGVMLWLVLPVAAGGNGLHWALFAAAAVPASIGLAAWRGRRRWAPAALVGLVLVEAIVGSIVASRYTGFTMFVGLEGESSSPNAVLQPLRAPDVDLEAFLEPGPFVPIIGDDRYLTWAPPAAVYQRGYLAAQEPADWPALALERGTLFGVRDVLGYNPVQLIRYWTWIRVANELPLFYNATSIQRPSRRDVELAGIRFLVVPEGVPPTLPGHVVATADGYDLVEVDDPPPMASVVTDWDVAPGPDDAFAAILDPTFDPLDRTIVEGDPRIAPTADGEAGSATYEEGSPTEVRVTVTATAPSIVVVRQSFDDGWSATVDGASAPVLPADGFLLGVPVEAGAHEVRLTYRDDAVAIGLWLSGAVWLAMLSAFVVMLGRERRTAAATSSRRATSSLLRRRTPADGAPPR